MARLRLRLHRDDPQLRAVKVVHQRHRLLGTLHVGLLAVQARELRNEARRLLAVLRRLHAQDPVGHGREPGDLALALDDQPQCHALHAARRERVAVLQVLPQEGRHLEAHQTVQDAARLLRVHARQVDFARMIHRLAHRVLRDLVVRHAMDGLAFRHVGQHRVKMPRDRLSFAVGIRREVDLVARLRGLAQLVDDLFLVRRNLVARRKRPCARLRGVRRDLDRQPLLRQVAYMPHRGLHREVPAKVLADRLRLRGRFDDE